MGGYCRNKMVTIVSPPLMILCIIFYKNLLSSLGSNSWDEGELKLVML
jgi:hypothetical protein